MCGHRLFIAEGRLLYAVKRLPISVKADGLRTISSLIADANINENKKAPWDKYKSFPNDSLSDVAIKECGYTLDSVVEEGIWIPLRDIESGKWGREEMRMLQMQCILII